jgi:di/tripeptidase
VADENIFGAKKITTLGIGPIGGNTHAPNEWVSISSMEKLQKILMDFLTQIDINQML